MRKREQEILAVDNLFNTYLSFVSRYFASTYMRWRGAIDIVSGHIIRLAEHRLRQEEEGTPEKNVSI